MWRSLLVGSNRATLLVGGLPTLLVGLAHGRLLHSGGLLCLESMINGARLEEEEDAADDAGDEGSSGEVDADPEASINTPILQVADCFGDRASAFLLEDEHHEKDGDDADDATGDRG